MTDTKDYGPEPLTINIEDDTKANTISAPPAGPASICS